MPPIANKSAAVRGPVTGELPEPPRRPPVLKRGPVTAVATIRADGAVELPRVIVDALGGDVGDQVELTVERGGWLIGRLRKAH